MRGAPSDRATADRQAGDDHLRQRHRADQQYRAALVRRAQDRMRATDGTAC